MAFAYDLIWLIIRLENFGLFSVTKASIPEVSKMDMEARVLSISWHIGSVTSTSVSKSDCKSGCGVSQTPKIVINREVYDGKG
jgi:hypothetical protein